VTTLSNAKTSIHGIDSNSYRSLNLSVDRCKPLVAMTRFIGNIDEPVVENVDIEFAISDDVVNNIDIQRFKQPSM
jgi:hypothetical protein